ncbi:methionine synthase reductase [Anabrus simplex]|uniref:methionine synthase reductase n=1 Tax=Anabrus simplex TaxID=316456 RepID=UPI0035A35D87
MNDNIVNVDHTYSFSSETCIGLTVLSPALVGVKLNLPPLLSDNIDLQICDKDFKDAVDIQNKHPFPLASTNLFHAPLLSASTITSGDDVKEVLEIFLDVSSMEGRPEFVPGDTIGIIPCNSDHEVEQILRYLGLTSEANKEYSIILKPGITANKLISIPPYIPLRGCLRHVFKTCVDFRTIPKKAFLRLLAEYTSSSDQKRRLEELCSRQGAAEYTKYIVEARTTVLDILATFPSCRPPVARILEHLPRLLPRPYSIASSHLTHPNSVRIVVTVVEIPRPGLCSNWIKHQVMTFGSSMTLEQMMKSLDLKEKPLNVKIPVFFRKTNNFRLPVDPSVPLILIGPGTGIAPFIGFLEHRAAQLRNTSDKDCFGEIWVFFGCRYSDRDFLYRSELDKFLEDGVLSRLFTSFSREDNSISLPLYVQDNIKLHSKQFVSQLLDKNAVLFVCGDANSMCKDVMETIINVVQQEQGVSQDKARSIILNLQKSGRYLQDSWL